MNKEYINRGDKVIINDELGDQKVVDNCHNIEEILSQENAIEYLKNKLFTAGRDSFKLLLSMGEYQVKALQCLLFGIAIPAVSYILGNLFPIFGSSFIFNSSLGWLNEAFVLSFILGAVVSAPILGLAIVNLVLAFREGNKSKKLQNEMKIISKLIEREEKKLEEMEIKKIKTKKEDNSIKEVNDKEMLINLKNELLELDSSKKTVDAKYKKRVK